MSEHTSFNNGVGIRRKKRINYSFLTAWGNPNPKPNKIWTGRDTITLAGAELKVLGYFLGSSYKSKAGSSKYTDLPFRFPFSSKLLNPVPSRVYGSRSLPSSSNLPGPITSQHWIKPSWNENKMKIGFGWKSAITFLGFLKINHFFKTAKKKI